jgi:hypothetical protein
MTGSADDGGEHGTGGVVTGETGLTKNIDGDITGRNFDLSHNLIYGIIPKNQKKTVIKPLPSIKRNYQL